MYNEISVMMARKMIYVLGPVYIYIYDCGVLDINHRIKGIQYKDVDLDNPVTFN